MSELGHARHQARQRALELLYEASMKSRSPHEVLGEQPLAPDAYVVTLLHAVETHRDRADSLISRQSHQWALERIALLDRLIMTLALCELLLDDAPPVAVVLDEAVELAKTYSTDDSPSFVNGVLSGCVPLLRDGD